MGKLGKHLKCVIGKFIVQTIEPYLGLNLECRTADASGEDCPPLENDRIVLVKLDGTGEYVAVGVLSVSQGANPGEKILYSRDSDGNVKAVVKMLNDGVIDIESPGGIKVNDEKTLELTAKEDVSVKGKKAVNVEGNTMELKSTKTVLTGGDVQCDGTAAPNGQGCFCGLPSCAFTGAPHTGNIVSGA